MKLFGEKDFGQTIVSLHKQILLEIEGVFLLLTGSQSKSFYVCKIGIWVSKYDRVTVYFVTRLINQASDGR